MAIYYPDKPEFEERNEMRNFIKTFSKVYPCKECSEHFQNDIKENPPDVYSGEGLSIWMC